MKKEWADKWVAALRSGDYMQARGRMFRKHPNAGIFPFDEYITPAGYCCLGVLECIVSGNKEPSNSILSDPTQKEISNHRFTYHFRGMLKLVHMNDNLRMSFKQIADFIEKEWAVL